MNVASSRIFTFFFLLLCLAGSSIASKAAFPVAAGHYQSGAEAAGAADEEELAHNRLVLNKWFRYKAVNTEQETAATEKTYTFLLLGSIGLLAPCIVFLYGKDKKKIPGIPV